MTPHERETAVLDRVRASLIAEGFEVITHPGELDLPDFLQQLRPDALAHKGNEHVVVEVMSRGARTEAKLRLLRLAVSEKPNWRLKTVWTSSHTVPQSLEIPSLDTVNASLHEVDDLIESGHLRAAFLMCWAGLEGISRLLLPDELQKPQTPGRVIEYLSSSGFILREEASRLRKMIESRNRLVHGVLQANLTQHEVIEIRDVLWKLHDIARDGPELD